MGCYGMFLEVQIWTWLLPIGMGLLIGVLLAGRKNHDYSAVVALEPEEFRQNMRKGQLVDLRLAKDFEAKRINGSRNFPKMSVFGNLSLLRKDLAVFVVDATDSNLVKRFSRKLIRKGFIRVYTLKGGLAKWTFGFKE